MIEDYKTKVARTQADLQGVLRVGQNYGRVIQQNTRLAATISFESWLSKTATNIFGELLRGIVGRSQINADATHKTFTRTSSILT